MAPSRASICRACWCCLPLAQWAGEHGLPAQTHEDAVSKSKQFRGRIRKVVSFLCQGGFLCLTENLELGELRVTGM